jgi:hypothetical protein
MGVTLDVLISLVFGSSAAAVGMALDILVDLFILTASAAETTMALDILFAQWINRLFVHACTPSERVLLWPILPQVHCMADLPLHV